mgnify:CR=1 FL=1
MTNNSPHWNQKKIFSWAHIITFLTLIFYSYIAFMGFYYLSKGDLYKSLLVVFCCNLALVITFIGAQFTKASKSKFRKRIKLERLLIALSPIVLIGTLIPYNHFWNVYSQQDKMVNQFSQSILQAQKMFNDYELYAKNRIDLLAKDKKHTNEVMLEAYTTTLELQLLSKNTTELSKNALKWITHTQQGRTIWNAFLIGNVQQIANAIKTWNNMLIELSRPVLSVENSNVKSFDTDKKSLNAVLSDLNNLTLTFTHKGCIHINTIISSVFLFIFLLFPYLVQSRHTKAYGHFFLLPFLHKKRGKKSYSNNKRKKANALDNKEDDSIFNGTL